MTLALYIIFFPLLAQSLSVSTDSGAPIVFQDGKFIGKQAFESIGFYQKFIDETPISLTYFKGEYMIYDCVSKHFACVNSSGYQDCQRRMKHAVKQRYSTKVCLPIKKFKGQIACFEKHYIVQEKSRMKIFCRN